MAINPLDYVKESKAELDKVVWPTRAETVKLTALVLIVAILVGAYVAGLDTVLTLVVEKYLVKN